MTTTPETQTPKILLDGKSYEIDLISDEAKAICGELQANDNLVAHHSTHVHQFRIAGVALKNQLVELLKDVPYEVVESTEA
jgi:hypothetical protein